MTRAVKSSAIVVAALWVGVLFCLGFVVAPYLFILAARQSPAVPNSGVAADLIGPLLYGADVAGLVVGAGLLAALLFLRGRGEVALGGRLYLGAYGVGLGATGLTFHDDDVVRFFEPHAAGKDAIFVTALGSGARRSPAGALPLTPGSIAPLRPGGA